jgi:hypothetical protein
VIAYPQNIQPTIKELASDMAKYSGKLRQTAQA